MHVSMFIILILFSCHGQELELQKSRWKPSRPPFRPAESCGEEESTCNLHGYDSTNGITNAWMPHYYGCIEEGKERQCCPPGWKYNHKSFYTQDQPEYTCVLADAVFVGESEIHGNRQFCKGKSEVSCRVNTTREDGKGKSYVHYKHICQDKSSSCNGECYEGYKKKYNFKDNVLECKLNKKGRDLEEDDDKEDNENNRTSHTTSKPNTITSDDTENKFNSTTIGTKPGDSILTSTTRPIIGVGVTALIIGLAITWCYFTDKKGKATRSGTSEQEDPGVFKIKDKQGNILSEDYIRSCSGCLLDRESSCGQFLAQLKRYHGTEIIEKVEENDEYGYAYGLCDYESGEIVDYNVAYRAAEDSDSDGNRESVAEVVDHNTAYGRASTSS